MDGQEAEVRAVIEAWDRDMVSNDADEIGRYMAEDWEIIGPDGSVGGKARFVELVRSGALTHDVMESHDLAVRVYGDTAIAVARGISGGLYHGEPFHLTERVSSTFIRQAGGWCCVLTHLSLLSA